MRAALPLAILGAVALAIATHLFVLDLDFHADDYRYQQGIAATIAARSAPLAEGSAEAAAAESAKVAPSGRRWLLATWRPVLDLTSGLLYQIDGRPDPRREHAFSLALFGICTALVVLFAARLGASAPMAFWSGTLFALHPGSLHGAAWISARGDLYWVVFTLGALLVLLAMMRPAPKGGTRLRRAGRLLGRLGALVILLLLGGLAVFSKETGFVGVAVILGIAIAAGFRRRLPRWWISLLVLCAASGIGLYFKVRSDLLGPSTFAYLAHSGPPGLEDLRRFIEDGLPLLWPQLLLGQLPPPAAGYFFWTPVVVVAVLGAGLVLRCWRRWPLLFVLLLVGVLSTVPVVYFLPRPQDAYYARFLVAWTACFATALGIAGTREPAARLALPLIAAFLGLGLWRSSSEITDVDRRFRAAVEPVRAIVEEAGPAADLVVVRPSPDRDERVLAPWWAWPLALEPPFLERHGRRLIFATWLEARSAPDPADPAALLLASRHPLVLLFGRRDEHRMATFVSESLAGATDSPLPAALPFEVGPRGTAEVALPEGVPPRCYPVLRLGTACATDTEGRVMLTAGGRDLVARSFEIPGGGRRDSCLPLADEALWRRAGLPDDPTVRLYVAGRGLFELAAATLERRSDLLVVESEQPRISRSGGEPPLVIGDRIGAPYLRLCWEAAFLDGPDLVYRMAVPRGCPPGARRDISWTGGQGVANGDPLPLFTLLSAAEHARICREIGAEAIPLDVSVEAAWDADGPAIFRSPPLRIEVTR